MGCVWEGGVRNLGRVDPELPHFPDSEQSMAWRPRQGPGMAPPPKGEALGGMEAGKWEQLLEGSQRTGEMQARSEHVQVPVSLLGLFLPVYVHKSSISPVWCQTLGPFMGS